jgi:hypothetical protein
MTSRECFENKWFYMKYIGKYLSVKMYNKNSDIKINCNNATIKAENFMKIG